MGAAQYTRWITPDGLTVLRGWAREGRTDEEIAKRIGVDPSSLYNWKRRFPQLKEALQKGKAVIDFEVEEALIKSALGYEYTEKVITKQGDDEPVVKFITKHAPPNPTALIFWLKNRKPGTWRDTYNQIVNAKVNVKDASERFRKRLEDIE